MDDAFLQATGAGAPLNRTLRTKPDMRGVQQSPRMRDPGGKRVGR
jgi:hypothetical protein